jgi:hypothetical protein
VSANIGVNANCLTRSHTHTHIQLPKVSCNVVNAA